MMEAIGFVVLVIGGTFILLFGFAHLYNWNLRRIKKF